MANASEIERPVRPSVLDRLIDDDPRSNVEPPLTRSQSVRQFKTALRRDLEWLLNARRVITPVPDECEELARSVFTFGLPDITSMSKDSRESFERLARLIQSAIDVFEPRLGDVSVALREGDSKLLRDVHFVIDGILRLDPLPERVMFDTQQDERGAMKVQEGGGGG
ncbi:MAG TPA: type VI secretion system baseplate subunit TssE [Gemmatimonadaceae bacterium]|nr:type VI secretion system baseplate subunit TssE [Gemmatimonadaceae bacterium]